MPTLVKRIHQAFGISAPHMTVRTKLAWYWRWLAMVAIAIISFAGATWIYDAGRRFAGFDRSEVEQELNRLREAVGRLENDNLRMSALASVGEARLKMEQAAQGHLAKQVKSLEEENRRLREDLAFFETLSPTADKLSINRFTVQPDILPGEYRYRLLVVIGGERRDRHFQGSLQLVLNVQRQGRDAMIVLPEAAPADTSAFRLSFKYFQRVEGTFRVPQPGRLQSVQARVLESGSSQARASQNVEL
jgi:uncharacterized protein DUF6776